MTFLNTLKENRTMMFFLLILAVAAIMAPEFAFANEGAAEKSKYNFVPDAEVSKGFSDSYKGIWAMIAEAGMWGAVVWLLVSILFLKGKFWYISPLVFIVAFFAESAVEGGKQRAGISMHFEEQATELHVVNATYESKLAKAYIDGLA